MAIGKTQELEHLTDFEESIYACIKEILSKNQVFKFTTELVELCCKKVDSSEYTVIKTLYSLLQRKIIVPGSRLTREDVLENQNRNQILNLIREKPGQHIRELCVISGKCSGVVRAHLKILENFNYIRIKKFSSPKLALLFPEDFPEIYDTYFLILKNKNDQQIIQKLINHQMTISELSSELGVHHSTIQYHLKKLERLDLVIRMESENQMKYAFNKVKLDTFSKFLEEITV